MSRAAVQTEPLGCLRSVLYLVGREVLIQVLVSKSNVLRPAVFDAYTKDVKLMVFLCPRCLLKVVLPFVHYLGSCRLLNLSVRVVMTASKCLVT